MLRTAAKKVAWVGRTASMVFGLALVMALIFGAVSVVLAANGNPFILGKAANTASKVTGLVRSGAGPALSLRVDAGQPPIAVNSAATVANLNADLLDGKSEADFLAVDQKADDSDALDGLDSTQLKAVGRSTRGGNCTADAGTQTCAQTTVDLPAPGRVLLNSTGSWWAFDGFPASGILTGYCILKEAGSLEDISETASFVGERQAVSGARPVHTAFSQGNQAITYVTGVLPAGQHTFQVRCTQSDGDVDWGSVTLSAVTLGDG